LHLDRRLTPLARGLRTTVELATYLRAGMGYGGSCLPKDVAALRAHAEAVGAPVPLLDALTAVNAARPGRVLELLARELEGLAGRTVAVLGLAFKPGTDDVRASPGLAAAEGLVSAGATVRVHDPLVRPGGVAWPDGIWHTETAEEALGGADAALIATAWPDYTALPWDAITATMSRPIVLDGRNALRNHAWPPYVRYLAIGRAAEASPQESL
jgi:nucleotide sugar dehydrogenase